MRPLARNRGFSLVELIIVIVIIGIIAMIAVPKLSRAARNAGASALRGNLVEIRHAIELYSAEHEGRYPDNNIVHQLTKYTNRLGDIWSNTKVPPDCVYGPYLKEIPPLPIGSKRGKSNVATDSVPGSVPTGAGGQAWWYNTADFVFKANLVSSEVDDDGIAFNTY